jgi:hypothetical protein
VDGTKGDLAQRMLDLYAETTARAADLRAQLDDAEHAAAGLRQALVAMGVGGLVEAKELSGDRLREELYEVLQEIDPEHRGIHYQDLTQRVLARGVTIRGQDKANNVRAHMSNSRLFRSVGRGIVTWVGDDAES